MRLETGMALILVIILLGASSLLLAHLMLQSFIGQKMAYNLTSQIKDWVDAEQQLCEHERLILENTLMRPEEVLAKKTPDLKLTTEVQRIRFVPDHLAFGCDTGINIYKVTVSSSVKTFESTIAIISSGTQEKSNDIH